VKRPEPTSGDEARARRSDEVVAQNGDEVVAAVKDTLGVSATMGIGGA